MAASTTRPTALSTFLKRCTNYPLFPTAVLLAATIFSAAQRWPVIPTALFVLALVAFAWQAFRDNALGVVGIIAVIYLLPFAVGPLPLGPYHLTLLDYALTITLLAWLAKRLVTGRSIDLTPLVLPLLLFLALATVSLAGQWIMLPPERFRLFLKMIISMLVVITVVNCLITRDAVASTVRALLVCVGVSAAAAVVLYVLPNNLSTDLLSGLIPMGYPRLPLRFIADTNIQRAIGTSIDPNLLGGALACSVPVLFSQLMHKEPLLRRRTIAVLTVLVACALAMTYSRTAWGAALVGVGFLTVVRYRVLALAFLAVAVLVALTPQGNALWERFIGGLLFADRAGEMRLGEYRNALELLKLYPVFGIGFGYSPDVHYFVGVSSGYLLLAQQTGLAGATAYVLVLSLFFWTVRRRWTNRRYRWDGGLTLGLCGSVVVALSAAVFDHYFINPQFPHAIALLWASMGLTLAAARFDL